MEKKSALGLASKNMIPIPKRKMASKEPHLEECKIGGREEIEIKAYLSQCLLDPNDNLKMCEFTKICLIYNPSLLQSFSEKRREMKSLGRRGQELEVGFGFLVVKHSATVESIYRQGLCVNHCDIKALGDPSQGVYLTRHIDICLKVCIQRGLLRGTIVIFKVLYGRVKSLIPRTQHDKPLEPSCNYDCHIPQKVPKINEPLNLQVCSLVYLYEYDSIMLPVKRPRQCLPYAVINMHQTFTGAKATPRASLTSSWSLPTEGSALETYVELQMLLETTHYIQNRLNFLKGLPRFRTLLWYETSLGMESLEYTFAGTLVNCHELSNLKKEIYAARARLSRCTANHYLLLKCNAESLEYEHLETRRLKSSILPHPPQSGMVNLGNSVGELEAQRKCIQHLLGKLFFAPATDRNVEKIEHLNLIISTIKRKQQWLKSNQYTALDPKQISKFGMDHLEWNAAKMLVCQELKAKEPFDKKDSQEIFSEVKERLRKMTANDVVPDVRAAVEDAKDWHKFLQSFSFPRTISISIQTPRSDNGSGHCSVVAVPGSEGNTAPKSLPSAEAHGSDSGNNMEQVAAAALTSRQHTQSTKHSNGSSRHREEYPADLPTKRTRFSFDSDIHGVGLHASSSDVALLEEQPCVKTRNVENATGETHAQLQLFECPTLVIQTGDANLQILRQEGEQDEKYEDKMPGNSIHTTVDQAEVKFAPADPGWDGEDCSTQIQELQSNPQPNSTESCAESVFEVWDTPEWFPARCRQTMKN
ncbi:uncharacterized protein LOC116952776 isoform X2 [Petromyzon marinus]|uniref:uncharacterized protein LOC116952776 isoform X2 n=1 Tax=Petromyzon marinus TaxID=7757 RepID=UPI003F6E77C6